MYIGDFVRQFLPPAAELLQFEKSYDKPAIIFTDLDGDSAPEIAAAYRLRERNGFIILKCIWGLWHIIANLYFRKSDSELYDSDSISREDLLGLLYGWQDSVSLHPPNEKAPPVLRNTSGQGR